MGNAVTTEATHPATTEHAEYWATLSDTEQADYIVDAAERVSELRAEARADGYGRGDAEYDGLTVGSVAEAIAYEDSEEYRAAEARERTEAAAGRKAALDAAIGVEAAAYERGYAIVNGEEYPLDECPASICRIAKAAYEASK